MVNLSSTYTLKKYDFNVNPLVLTIISGSTVNISNELPNDNPSDFFLKNNIFSLHSALLYGFDVRCYFLETNNVFPFSCFQSHAM